MKHPPAYLQKLRAATESAHKQVEKLTQAERLLLEELDIDIYRRLLSTHLRFHREVAHHFSQWQLIGEKPLLDWPECQRIQALEKDLSLLGVSPDQDQQHLPFRSTAFTIGLCYVAEGSCLGNQMMYNSLRKKEAYKQWGAHHFYESCKEGFGKRWGEFLSLMGSYAEHNYEDLEAGGKMGFQLFERYWMERAEPRLA